MQCGLNSNAAIIFNLFCSSNSVELNNNEKIISLVYKQLKEFCVVWLYVTCAEVYYKLITH